MNKEQEEKNELSSQYDGSGDDSSSRPDNAGQEAAEPSVDDITKIIFFSGHIPPPFTIEDGSVAIRCDRRIDGDDAGGPAARRNRCRPAGLDVSEIKILNDTGNVIYLNNEARTCEVHVWLNQRTAPIPVDRLPVEPHIVVKSNLLIEAKDRLDSNEELQTSRRKFRRKAVLDGGDDVFISRVRVVKGARALFEDEHADPKNHAYRISIWPSTM